ncbi:nucleotide-binding protein (plasmid) [Burkholderia cenocepacia]|uniref:TIR domain-containing protein n=1 Tax=Burkholderia cepacia complex TaxID=87882 RepID=UPI00068D138C|nr:MULTISPECIES: nucleotide-binding protein [Burkholderia cepacia complex]UJH77458.1 nucleotide-binding protein [Burkholderia cenocepacia]
MRPNDYYNLIVSAEEGHWDRGEGKTLRARFHYCSEDAIKERFPMSDAVEMTLKSFPAVFACEGNGDSKIPAVVGRITKIEHRRDNYYLHFEADPDVPPIPQKTLLELADALDISTRGFGDLGCSHWSVKQVDLYNVLQRNNLTIPLPDAHTSGADGLGGTGQRAHYPRSAYLNRLNAEIEHEEPQVPHASAAISFPFAPAGNPVKPVAAGHVDSAPSRPRVFIVHGHDREAKYEVQALLERLGLEGVILDEQAGRGGTIIEKFEREAGSAAFAVVLLTPDDKGGVAAAAMEELKPRARQNVILELGYFAAKLGRGHVCALRRGSVEIPSDFNGVQYIDYDAGGAWKVALAKEMRAVGLSVNFHRL